MTMASLCPFPPSHHKQISTGLAVQTEPLFESVFEGLLQTLQPSQQYQPYGPCSYQLAKSANVSPPHSAAWLKCLQLNTCEMGCCHLHSANHPAFKKGMWSSPTVLKCKRKYCAHMRACQAFVWEDAGRIWHTQIRAKLAIQGCSLI